MKRGVLTPPSMVKRSHHNSEAPNESSRNLSHFEPRLLRSPTLMTTKPEPSRRLQNA